MTREGPGEPGSEGREGVDLKPWAGEGKSEDLKGERG